MDERDQIMLLLDAERTSHSALIACLFTGTQLPRYCAAMARRPSPLTGMPFDRTFPTVVANALSTNPAVHDGAVMIGRSSVVSPYQIVGWSFRLFPPEDTVAGTPNRGSAFNSCRAMAHVETLDRVYLVSAEAVFTFTRGGVERLQRPRDRAGSTIVLR